MLSIKIIKFLLPDVLWPSERKTLGSGSRSLRCWLSLRLSAMWDIFKELHLIFLNQAFLIAFTSDFIQKLVYKFEYGERGVMKGYVMFTLSKSPVKNWISRGQVSPKNSQNLDCQAKTPLKLHSQKPNMVFGTFTFLQILFSNSTLQSFSKWKIKLPC